jgi:hypothetical protein
MITIQMTATYDTVEWEDGSEEPITTHGFTDPSNPWGGWKYELPDGVVGETAKAWMAENVETLTFNNLLEAAQFVADFTGGVWDYSECEPDQDYRTGISTRVTLHVHGHEQAVFAIARQLESARDRELAERRGR